MSDALSIDTAHRAKLERLVFLFRQISDCDKFSFEIEDLHGDDSSGTVVFDEPGYEQLRSELDLLGADYVREYHELNKELFGIEWTE